MEKIDVVMLAYNFSEELRLLTETAIASVRKTPMGKLIIIDNGSTVGAGNLRELSDVCVVNKTNLGYPAAVNQGIALAKSKYIAISNNDIRISSNWVEIANTLFEMDPKVGSVHFKMIPYEESFDVKQDAWIGGKERWCHCSFFVIRREAFQGYDEAFGAGGYDDYSHNKRMRDKGWKQAYTNAVAFQHMDSITYRTMEDKEKRAIRDNKNREHYKDVFGEYPDVQFANEFPEQMQVDYTKGWE